MYEDILEKLSDRRRVFDGAIIHVDHMTALLPNGKTALREVAVHMGASAVVPVDEEGNVYLVRQFRAPLEKVTLEIPAGKLDHPGENRLEAAQRELREETGFSADSWKKLTDLATTPGFCSEVISIYLAQNLHSGKTHDAVVVTPRRVTRGPNRCAAYVTHKVRRKLNGSRST